MNRSTRFTIFCLALIFFIAQVAFALAFVNVIIVFFSMGLIPKSSDGIMLWGIDATKYDGAFLTIRHFEILILILAMIVCVISFFLYQFLRTLLQSLNEEQVFNQNNLTKIKRILLLYLSLGVINFGINTLCSLTNVHHITGSTENILGSLLQVGLTTAGIYTLYFVFKYGTVLKKENEAIV